MEVRQRLLARVSRPTPGECCHKASSPGPWEVNWGRNVTVYIPAAYRDGDAAPVFVIQDGPAWLVQVASALDNLSPAASPDPANRSLPAFIAIAVENGGSDAIKSEQARSMTQCLTDVRALLPRKCFLRP